MLVCEVLLHGYGESGALLQGASHRHLGKVIGYDLQKKEKKRVGRVGKSKGSVVP